MRMISCYSPTFSLILLLLLALNDTVIAFICVAPTPPTTTAWRTTTTTTTGAKPNNKPTWSGDKGTPSYSDDWLLSFHNQAQSEKQTDTNNLAIWNAEQEQEQASIREWQESFQRNGLADFTPPMSFGLNCLMVGEPNTAAAASSTTSTRETKLPWEEEAEADITSLEFVTTTSDQNAQLAMEGDDITISTRLVVSEDASTSETTTEAGLRVPNNLAAVYDCIVDQGLLGGVLLTNDEATVRELLLEASLALREHGIYVLHTQQLTSSTKQLLESFSQEAGLEWQFELDGISNDTVQISVARRFNTGEMPKVGRLSRYQP